MGTSVNSSQIGTIGNILESKGDNVLEKLSQELKAAEVVTPSLTGATPAQINAAQQAQAAYGQAAVAIGSKPYSEAAITSANGTVRGASSQFGNAVAAKVVADTVAKPAIEKVASLAKQKEKAHFQKVFKNIDKERDAARAALKERLKAYKAGKKAAKTGVFKRIGNFFSENGKKVSEFTKTKIWAPIKSHPRTAAAALAITAIVGGTIYAMSGGKSQNEEQIETEKV